MRIRSRVGLAAAGVLVLFLAAYISLTWDLPRGEELREELFSRYPTQGNSIWMPLWGISPKLRTAVVIWEDPTFFHHQGFNYTEIWRSLVANLRAGAYVRGGSTITQQLAKNLYLSLEKSLRRKLREAVLARRLERAFSKNQILEIYLNVAEWGPGLAGAEAAANHYFGKPASALDWGEAAMLASILQNPRVLNPARDAEKAIHYRDLVLEKLLRLGEISAADLTGIDAPFQTGSR